VIIQANCERLPLPDNSIDMIFTDPPYLEEYLPCYEWLFSEAMRLLDDDGFVLAMCGGFYLNRIHRMADEAGLSFYWQYAMEMPGRQTGAVWHYGQETRNPITVHQKAIIAWSKRKGAGSRTATTDRFICAGKDKTYHHWGQDVASARYFIDCFTSPGDLVLDPFIGGGTTAIACELIGRRWIGSDKEWEPVATTQARLSGADIPYRMPLFAEAAP
jgi:DNA modification methylase